MPFAVVFSSSVWFPLCAHLGVRVCVGSKQDIVLLEMRFEFDALTVW